MFKSAPKNQHYVWKHYLEAWAVDERLSCYRQRDRKLIVTNPKNVASETYFYRLSELTDVELAYLDAVASRAKNDLMREVHQNFVAMFKLTTKLRQLVAVAAPNEAARAASKKLLDQADLSLGELWHVKVEEKGQPLLARLRQRDASFWHNESDVIDFCFFLGTQYMRTARMRQAVCRAMPPFDVDLARVWTIESLIWATEIGAALFRHHETTRATVLVNETALSFIAGDQPVINLKPQADPQPKFYYPVTPDIALQLTMEAADDTAPTRAVTAMEAEHLNHAIYRWSEDQIYGLDGNYLKTLGIMPKVEFSCREAHVA
jgi:hypothetical protein